jgi:protein-S-isoprenylcysteine O-methyltransferase Ste14
MHIAERPNTVPWPPILYLIAGLAALALHWFRPLPWPEGGGGMALLMLGVLAVSISFALDISAALAFKKHKTSIMPHKAASELITSGPFAISRNPIYIAHTLIVAGIGLIFGVGWMIPTSFTAAVATHFLAVRREEQHLDIKFGQQWRDYAQTVPRWIGLRKRK